MPSLHRESTDSLIYMHAVPTVTHLYSTGFLLNMFPDLVHTQMDTFMQSIISVDMSHVQH